MDNSKKQFIYVLKLIPELYDVNNWTDREEKIVHRHHKNETKALKSSTFRNR
jgi:hypothetical protein